MKTSGNIFSLLLATSLVLSAACGDDNDFEGPNVSLNASVTSGVSPVTVAFQTYAVGEEPPFRYSFNFGDGSEPSTFPNPTHTYVDPGVYSPTVTVTDEEGGTHAASVTIEVIADVAPEATASSDIVTGQERLAVAFGCDGTSGNGDLTYRWDFGDGTRSDLANPVHIYEADGDYVATCIVTDEQGDFDTDSISISVTPDTVPAVQIATSSKAGISDFEVDFATVVTRGEAPFTYLWDFGDGATSTEETPSHTYTAGGQFEVVVTVTDSDGDEGVGKTNISVTQDDVPVAVITATPNTGIENLAVAFSVDVAGGNPPFDYAWDFGDGATSAAKNPNHTFSCTGAFDPCPVAGFPVTVTVTDANGSSDVDSVFVQIADDLDVIADANLALIAPNVAPQVAVFTSNTVGPDLGNAPLSFLWDFGDGNTSALQNPSHVYAAGTFQPVVTITDADGDSDTFTFAPIVINEDTKPEVVALASSVAGIEPHFVDFDTVVAGGNGTLVYSWTMGDGTFVGDLPTPNHIYAVAGTYTAVVTVTDEDGDVGFDTIEIAVGADSFPAVAISATPLGGAANAAGELDVSFTADVTGGNAPYTFDWDFDGNGSVDSTVQNPNFTYVLTVPTVDETFTATLTVTDSDGDFQFTMVTIDIEADLAPVIAPAGNPSGGLAPLAVLFDPNIIADGNLPHTFLWDFGDGGTSTLANPSHTYASAGTYTARLTVTDANGDEATDTVSTTVIDDLAPTAEIVSAVNTPTDCEIAVTFIGAGGNGALTEELDFGDGTAMAPSSLPEIYTYTNAGTYQIVYSVTDLDGDVAFDATTIIVPVAAGCPL